MTDGSRGSDDKPLVLITGAAGNIGRPLARALDGRYRVVGLDREGDGRDFPLIVARQYVLEFGTRGSGALTLA